LLLTIYEEAYNDPDLGPALQQNYVTLDDLRRDMPRLILANNLHGVDIDLRCTQIAALALWLRCQRAYNEMGLEAVRPRITRSNLVCAEPMPGEVALLEDFLKTLHDDRLPKLIRRVMDVPEAKPVRATPEMADRLCELVRLVWNQMKLAGEAGTLLRIEQELQVAIRKGQEEWEEDQPLFRVTQYALTEEPREKFTRIVPDEGVSFWERAEALVMAALDDFAEYTANGRGLLRKLFVNDAMRGFAFVDVCRLRFDVVLMNPPFGLIMRRHHEWLKRSYADAYVDVYASFLSRGLELCHGRLGAITSRSILMTKKLLRIRRKDIVPRIEAMLDLGAPVMDSAMVQSCAYTLLASDERRPDLFFSSDRRSLEDKSDGIHQPLSLCGKDFLVSNRSIVDLPHSKLLYSLPPKIRIMMQSAEHTGENAFIVRLGMKSFNDFRFLRLRWEIDPQRIGKDSEWEPLSKGGPYAVFYSDLPLLIRWNRTGNEIAEENMRANGQTAQARQASVYYRKAGGTYSRRCKDFGVRVLPAGCIIGEKGPAIFGKGELSDLFVIGFLNSRLMNALIHVQANAKQFDSGIVESLPWKALD